MAIDNTNFFDIINKNLSSTKNNNPIVLSTIFANDLEQGLLPLQEIDFFRFGPLLRDVDFSHCALKNCNFNFLLLYNCHFQDGTAANNNFDGVYSANNNTGIPINPASDQSTGLTFTSSKSLDVGESWSDQHKREQNWLNIMFAHYPQDVLKYERLRSFPPGIISLKDGYFIYQAPTHEEEISHYLGWKLHISVNQNQLPLAFNLAAPILVKYCSRFMVKDSVKNNLCQNAQFTILLEQNNRILLTVEAVQELIEKVTAIFKDHDIRPELFPVSDKATKSPYFSIRNDKYYIPEKFVDIVRSLTTHIRYLPASTVGSNFNPTNLINPFQQLLTESNKFNITSHFTQFKSKTRKQAIGAFCYSLIAYIREFTVYDKLDQIAMADFQKKCFSLKAELPSHYLKEEFRQESALKQNISCTVTILMYLIKYGFYEYSCEFSPELDPLTPIVKDIAKIEQFIEKLPCSQDSLDSGKIRPLIDFSQYMSEARILDATHELYNDLSIDADGVSSMARLRLPGKVEQLIANVSADNLIKTLAVSKILEDNWIILGEDRRNFTLERLARVPIPEIGLFLQKMAVSKEAGANFLQLAMKSKHYYIAYEAMQTLFSAFLLPMKESMKILEDAAKSGNAYAQLQLGMILAGQVQRETIKDVVSARHWLTRALENPNARIPSQVVKQTKALLAIL